MRLDALGYYVGTAAAQATMSLSNPDLRIDGKWGRVTQAAYERCNDHVQKQVREVLARINPGSTPDDYLSFRVNQKENAAEYSAAMFSGSDNLSIVKRTIARIAEEEGVPAKQALIFAELESRFVVSAKNPSGASGLFQMTQMAIDDVNRIYGKKNGTKFTKSDMFDAEKGTRAGVQYMKIVARALNVPLTDVGPVYMAYNIGIGNYLKLQAGKVDDTVRKAVLAQARRYHDGVPSSYIDKVSKIIETMQTAA